MMRTLGLTLVLFLASCVTATDDRMYVQIGPAHNPVFETDVMLLDELPTDRPYEVIGIIAPPEGEFESWAEMVNAIRRVAASKGANAIFLEEQTSDGAGGWKFSVSRWGASGGSVDAPVRAKAIVWKR